MELTYCSSFDFGWFDLVLVPVFRFVVARRFPHAFSFMCIMFTLLATSCLTHTTGAVEYALRTHVICGVALPFEVEYTRGAIRFGFCISFLLLTEGFPRGFSFSFVLMATSYN